MDCSTSGFPVHHQHLELTLTHVHRVGDAIHPFHPLLSPSPPALNLSQHQGLFPRGRCLPSSIDITQDQCDQWVDQLITSLAVQMSCSFWKLILLSQSLLDGMTASERGDSGARKLKIFCRIQTLGKKCQANCVYSWIFTLSPHWGTHWCRYP